MLEDFLVLAEQDDIVRVIVIGTIVSEVESGRLAAQVAVEVYLVALDPR